MRHAGHQRGSSLISLLVGLVISLIATVALMATFRVAAQVSGQVRESSNTDSQLISGLLRVGLILQDAGYGIAGPVFGKHLQPLTGATLNGSNLAGTAVGPGGSANALVWSSITSGTTAQCAGILAPSGGGLMYLGPVNCSSATDWNSLQWTSSSLATVSALATSSAVTLTAAAAKCSPYGLTGTQSRYQVGLTTANSSGVAVNASHCLQNFQ